MDKKKFNDSVTGLSLWFKEHDINYDEGLKLMLYMVMMALSEDKINAETNKARFLEVFNTIWNRYRDESKANS